MHVCVHVGRMGVGGHLIVITSSGTEYPLKGSECAPFTKTWDDRISSFFPHGRIFVWVYDVIILINAIFIALDEKNPFISYAEWLFLSLYIIEILLKLYTYEPRAYFGKKQFWNW